MTTTNCFDDIQACGLPPFDTRKPGLNIATLIATLWPRHRARRPVQIEIRDLPDDLLRDIGVLDGNRPTRGVKW